MSEPSAEQFGGVLAAPTRRQRRSDIAAIAGTALAVALAAAALIIAVHRSPPRGLIAVLSSPGGQACSAAFNPDGKTLAVADCNDSVSLWDVAARRWIATLASPRCPDGGHVAFSPDGKTLALFSGRDPATCLWDVAARQETTLTDPGGRAHFIYDGTYGAFSPGGKTLAVADSNGNIYLWDLATRHVTTTVPASRVCGNGCAVVFSPDGTMLAVGESDGMGERIYLWDLTARRWAGTLTDASGPAGTGLAVSSLAFSPDGFLAVGDVNSRVYLWDVAARRLTAIIAPPINVAQGNASISKDGSPYPSPGDFTQDVNVAFSPDGAILATGVSFGYGTSYLYDVATRRRVATLTDPGGQLGQWAASVVFSPGGTMLAVTDSNGRTYLWRPPRWWDDRPARRP